MQCPICHQDFKMLLHQFNGAVDSPLMEMLQREVPNWHPALGACTRCTDQAQIDAWTEFKGIEFGTEVNGYKILPIPTRLMAHPNYTGKGVTICFIDSGFYPHPDLEGRILAAVNIPNAEHLNFQTSKPETSAWHGTMTSVVGAGNGALSNGLYKSLAPEANVILLKVTDDQGSITGENITKALKWAIKNQKKYNIRIINLSVTDDWSTSYRENAVDQAIARAVAAGIVVVVAAGNDENAYLKAPANSPHAISVGGLDDHNTLHPLSYTLYHSTFGNTVDGIQKPDLLAPAIWIPAPILPETNVQKEAALLFDLIQTQDDRYLKAKFTNVITQLNINKNITDQSPDIIRQIIQQEIDHRKLISPHYQHADGTSFAAPIVCSLIAQILEANPALTPAGVRNILTQTARKLPNAAVERQGFGVVHPLSAVYAAETIHTDLPISFTPLINYQQQTIEFFLHQHAASTVTATGDFTNWSKDGIPLQKHHDIWKRHYNILPKGEYRYKFIINDKDWVSDPTNILRELDGFGGFNSKLIIE
ncbi:MAG: S8 family serine peptidase [Saprospiraceae bacterium]